MTFQPPVGLPFFTFHHCRPSVPIIVDDVGLAPIGDEERRTLTALDDNTVDHHNKQIQENIVCFLEGGKARFHSVGLGISTALRPSGTGQRHMKPGAIGTECMYLGRPIEGEIWRDRYTKRGDGGGLTLPVRDMIHVSVRRVVDAGFLLSVFLPICLH